MFGSRRTSANKAKRKIRFARLKPKFRNALYIFTVSLSAWLVAMWVLHTRDDLKLMGFGDFAVPLATLSTVVSAYWALPKSPNNSVGFITTGLLTGLYTVLIFGILFTMKSLVNDSISGGAESALLLPSESFAVNFLWGILYILILALIFYLYVGMTAMMVVFFTFGTCILIPIVLAWLFWPLMHEANPRTTRGPG